MGCLPIPKRYIFVVLSHLAFFIVFALRVNFSVAIVAMINSTSTKNDSSNNNNKNDDGEFNWSEVQPALYVMVEAWSPIQEQSTISSLCYSGSLTGMIVSIPICGYLAQSGFLGGWPSTFYVFGFLGVVWFVLWMFMIHESPDKHPTITPQERAYINGSHKKDDTNKIVPWIKLFASPAVWAIIVGIFCDSWIFNLVSTDLPLYFHNVLNLDLQSNGIFTMLPFAVGFISSNGSAVLSDILITKGLGVAFTRRIMSSIATYLAAVALFVATYASPGHSTLPVTCFMMCNFFLQINKSGCFMNGFDISPRYVSIIFGISNTLASIPGFVVPIVTGVFTNHDASQANYRKVFILAAAVSVFGGTVFNVLVKGDRQAWDEDNDGGNNKVTPDVPTHSQQVDDSLDSGVV